MLRLDEVKQLGKICVVCAGTLFIAGCGGDDPDAVVAAPPPAAPAEVQLTEKAPDVAAPGAETPAPDQTAPAELPPPTTDEGLAAITKGMTPAEIEKFKETATFENFDTNIQIIQEAANSFYNEFQRRAPTVDALVTAGYLARKPVAPKGKKYVIDPENGSISSVDLK